MSPRPPFSMNSSKDVALMVINLAFSPTSTNQLFLISEINPTPTIALVLGCSHAKIGLFEQSWPKSSSLSSKLGAG